MAGVAGRGRDVARGLREDLATPLYRLRPHHRHAWVRRSIAVLAGVAMALAFAVTLRLIGVRTGTDALAIGVLVAVLPVPVYVATILLIDRYEPEPPRLQALAFFYGASVAVLIAFVVNTFVVDLLAVSKGFHTADIYGRSISAPVVEEGAKAAILVFLFLRYRGEFYGVVDGLLYAALVGIGFAMTENVLYYARGALEHGIPGALGVFVTRGVLSPFMHPFFTAMTGLGLGLASQARRGVVRLAAGAAGLAAAVLLHSAWNTAVGAGLFLGVYFVLMVPGFFAIAIVIVAALGREAKVIGEQLQPEVAAGLISPDELHNLTSIRGRVRMLRGARRRGRADYRASREWVQTATELAFLRRRAGRDSGEQSDSRASTELETAYLDRMRRLRPRLRNASPAQVAVA